MMCLRNECRGKVSCAPMETVDDAVMSAIRLRIKELQVLANQAENVQQTNENQKNDEMKKQIESAWNKLKKQKDKLYTLLETDVYTTEVFIERLKIIEKQELQLKEEWKTLCEESEKEHDKLEPDAAILFLLNVVEKFQSATSQEKNALLKGVIKRIAYRKTERMCKNKMQSDLSLDIVFL